MLLTFTQAGRITLQPASQSLYLLSGEEKNRVQVYISPLRHANV